MNLAWEITDEDIEQVLSAHGATDVHVDRARGVLDEPAIVGRLLTFTSIEEQTDSMLEDIEGALLAAGLLPSGQRRFAVPRGQSS